MPTTPLVSVVVPLYNKAGVVAATLRSASNQSFKDFEIIVVDDGSTDGSAESVALVADPRLRLIRQANAGVSAARNTGIHAARGTWIALLDADDAWEPDHLETLVSAARANNASFVFGNVKLESRDGGPNISGSVPAHTVEDFFAFALRHGGYPVGSSVPLVHRGLFDQAGLFAVGVPMGEDTDMWCRLACKASVFYTGRTTATYHDVPRHHSVAGNLRLKAVAPIFAARLPDMVAAGEVPATLRASARRYANFLLLEYARQLLDREEYKEARAVLLGRCNARLDPVRYFKRLLRTWPAGRAIYTIARGQNPSFQR
jgi:glycosyltransferase involved in cell wall biosynthesis